MGNDKKPSVYECIYRELFVLNHLFATSLLATIAANEPATADILRHDIANIRAGRFPAHYPLPDSDVTK